MDKFDIIVIAGQSNAQGMGVGEVKNEYNPTPDIWQLEQPKTVEHRSDAAVVTFTGSPQLSIADEILNNNKEKVGNFAFSFARNYIEKLAVNIPLGGHQRNSNAHSKTKSIHCRIGGTGK